ncbi:MAG: helix-turn-helix domain-containing protein [bacterium]|nr:helix-turn-helix domain-containing protein [bacterium]
MSIETDIKQFLVELDLNEAEIAVYLATLELGSGVASTIAKSAGLNRITAYEALKRLSTKGFIRIRAKRNDRTKYFVPVEYSDIVAKLKSKQEEITEAIKKAEALKGEFEANFSSSEEKPVVLFYEGVEGIKTVLMDTLKKPIPEIISFASAESLDVGFEPDFLQKYWNKRVSMGIPSRGIIPKTERAKQWFSEEKNKKELRGVKFISPKNYDFKNEIDIYGDSVGITSLTKGTEHGIIIRSASIADSLRQVFETLWNLDNPT